MTTQTPQYVFSLAKARGATYAQAVVATAVAWAESALNDAAVGDVQLEDATWGPSLGLWQIRSLKAQLGTGQVRDASRLLDPNFNATSAQQISKGWTDFTEWTTYNNGQYQGMVALVKGAVLQPDAATPTPASAPVIGTLVDWAGGTKSIHVQIPGLDAQGNGYVDVSVGQAAVQNVIVNGQDPAVHGYPGLPALTGTLKLGSIERLIFHGPANMQGPIDITVWLAYPI